MIFYVYMTSVYVTSIFSISRNNTFPLSFTWIFPSFWPLSFFLSLFWEFQVIVIHFPCVRIGHPPFPCRISDRLMRQVIYVNRIFENTLISVIPSRIQLTLILNLDICCIVYDMSISVCCSCALTPGLQQGAYSAIPSNLIPTNCSDCVDPVHILQRSDVHRF